MKLVKFLRELCVAMLNFYSQIAYQGKPVTS